MFYNMACYLWELKVMAEDVWQRYSCFQCFQEPWGRSCKDWEKDVSVSLLSCGTLPGGTGSVNYQIATSFINGGLLPISEQLLLSLKI